MGVLEEDLTVVNALRGVGLRVLSIYNLVNSRTPYPEAIPVLLRLLPEVQDDRIKEGIMRALTVKEARGVAAKALIAEFNKISPEKWLLRWMIANALSVAADVNVAEDVLQLLQDNSHGRAREKLALDLVKTGHPRAVDVLIDLLDDEEVAGHAIWALGSRKDKRARPAAEKFLKHPKAWVRTEAKRALAKIDKAS